MFFIVKAGLLRYNKTISADTGKEKGVALKTDVIIPVYRPGRELLELLNRLREQTMPVHRIILMNTEKKYFEELMAQTGTDFAKTYGNAEVHHLSKREFDHGGTRHRAVQYSRADIFVMMTQDAMPADRYLIERLTAPLREGLAQERAEKASAGAAQEKALADAVWEASADEAMGEAPAGAADGRNIRVAVAYGRQLPGRDSSEAEKFSRYFNYPKESRIKTSDDLETMGIKTFFCSNVCAAYRRDIYEESGGFVRHTIFNEDMIYAAGMIRAGYGIAYEAGARVVHSHNYTNMQQLRRNFDLGVSQAEHPEVFRGVPSETEGKRLVKAVFRDMKRRRELYRFPGFCVQCGFKYAGYLLGKNYRKLPEKWIPALTNSKEYWKQEETICAEL
ncbi:MAG: glycosyltransferase [Butyrivibrio sp.]|nr:glycosyltransferase [Acetatifactor muris]MCM1559899.1 glycosyltransferase [Butyrivibrio sp.]